MFIHMFSVCLRSPFEAKYSKHKIQTDNVSKHLFHDRHPRYAEAVWHFPEIHGQTPDSAESLYTGVENFAKYIGVDDDCTNGTQATLQQAITLFHCKVD